MDLIDRQAAIDAVANYLYKVCLAFHSCMTHEESKTCATLILQPVPSAHRPADEWCTDCSEYDNEKHCCPRFNRVIRTAVDERKQGKWIDLHPQGDSRFMCSVCKWKEHVPTCMGKPTVWEYCPSCGARMDGDGNG